MLRRMRLWHICVRPLLPNRNLELICTIAMFYPKDNPGYFAMSEEARALIAEWATNEWYESSTGYQLAIENEL
jgi:hypothetical protein